MPDIIALSKHLGGGLPISAVCTTEQIAQTAVENGLIFQLRGTRGQRNVIRLVPPMTTTDDEVDRAMSIVHDAMKAT